MRSYKMSKIVVNAHQAMRGKYNNSVLAFSVQLTSKKRVKSSTAEKCENNNLSVQNHVDL